MCHIVGGTDYVALYTLTLGFCFVVDVAGVVVVVVDVVNDVVDDDIYIVGCCVCSGCCWCCGCCCCCFFVVVCEVCGYVDVVVDVSMCVCCIVDDGDGFDVDVVVIFAVVVVNVCDVADMRCSCLICHDGCDVCFC